MRKAACVLIIIGLAIFLYPYAERMYSNYQQQRLLAAWEESLPPAGDDGETAVPPAAEPAPPADPAGTVAVLEVDKINLRLPVLRGTSTANLRVAAGLLEDTAEIGAPGNTVLTAHRSHTRGRLFNRLDELAAGDVVTVTTREKTYRYTVTGSLIVEPDDMSVTVGGEEEYRLTLITCHPVYDPTHRLVVQAEMVPDGE
jgi:sortase A